jgi:hypothetical protein
MIPCMGGFCASRERCAHYYAESYLRPSERLCGKEERPRPIDTQDQQNQDERVAA